MFLGNYLPGPVVFEVIVPQMPRRPAKEFFAEQPSNARCIRPQAQISDNRIGVDRFIAPKRIGRAKVDLAAFSTVPAILSTDEKPMATAEPIYNNNPSSVSITREGTQP
jgi:hypothetical protein